MIQYKIDYSDNPGRRKPTFTYVADGDFMPFVSIVTPFYNEKRENFSELAASIFNQSFQYFEWIIVNDCSTDIDANSILEEYAQRDHRIRLVRNPQNLGLPASRNAGFRSARCDFIMMIDSDDVLEPTSLEKMFWRLFTYDAPMFCRGFTVGFGAYQYYWTKGPHNYQEMLTENIMTPQGVLLRKSLFEEKVFFDETIRDGLEDWHFWLRCAHAGYWGVTIPEAFDWYRRRPDQTDRWKNWQQKDAFLVRLRQEFPTLWEEGGFPQLSEPVYRFGELLSTLPAPNLLKKQNPRLLLIVPWLVMGGADQFNIMAIKVLKALGWEISVVTTVTTAEHVWRSEFYALTSDVFILEHFLEPWDYPRFLRYLIASRDHDAIMVSGSVFACRLMPYLRYHFPNKAFVNYTHLEEEHWQNGGHPRYAILYQRFFQSLYVTSEHLKDWMRSKGADTRHIETCYINVDTETWQKDLAERDHIRREFGVDESTPVILHAARICAQKQPDVLIKVLENLEKKGKDFLALIAGDGEDLSRIKEYSQEKCLTKVRFLGQVENEKVLRLMHGADIFFLPSMMEGIALSIYEAMSMGLAVLSADVGGQKELVSQDTGFLLHRSTPDEEINGYVHVLTDWIEQPEKVRKMGEEAAKRVRQHFSLDNLGKNLDRLLRADIARAKTDDPKISVDYLMADLTAIQVVDWLISENYTRTYYMQKNVTLAEFAKVERLIALEKRVFPLNSRRRALAKKLWNIIKRLRIK